MEDQKQTYLMFHLGEELFAMGVEHVKEIIEYSPPTKVPLSPAFMLGILNLRGQVLSVLDAKICFGLEASTPDAKSRIIILEIKQNSQVYELGVLVDSAHDVREIADSAIMPPPDANQIRHADFITGVMKEQEGFILVVDAQKVFTSEETIQLTDKREN